MNGWNTIKKVRSEMKKAEVLAKDGHKTSARNHLKYARNLLADYCKDERFPEHRFEVEEIGS